MLRVTGGGRLVRGGEGVRQLRERERCPDVEQALYCTKVCLLSLIGHPSTHVYSSSTPEAIALKSIVSIVDVGHRFR